MSESDMRRVILDMDVGIDDAVAIAYLGAHPGVEIVALGGVHGNCRATTATTNGLRALEFIGLPDVPVALGAEQPLARPLRLRPFVHGEDGMGDADIPSPQGEVTGEHAADQLIRLAGDSPGELDLFAVGPLTNVALALEKDPDLLTRFRSTVIMGGSGPFPRAGVFRQEDTNIEHDPEAAARVMAAPRSEVRMVGVNVTTATVLDEQAIAAIGASENPHAVLVTRILECYLNFYQHKWSRRICSLHDPLAAGVLADPVITKAWLDGPVNVVDDGAASRAWLMRREDGGELIHEVIDNPTTRVVTEVDRELMQRDLVNKLTMEA